MNRIVKSVVLAFLAVYICIFPDAEYTTWAAEGAYYHLVVLGDPHLPGKYRESKEHVIETINSWTDVDIVIPVGDLNESAGTDNEYAAVRDFFANLRKPVCPIAGNHDYIYESNTGPKGKRLKAGPDTRKAKLHAFRETFGLQEYFYSRRMGGYLLIFLSTDHLLSDNLAEMSERELKWLGMELSQSKKTPTIIFFHAPLKDTLRNYNNHINTPPFFAQPSEALHSILMENPQVFLWISGHTHTSPREESFAAPVNVYEKRITNIHNTDMNRAGIWTNSIYLYPDKVIVKTYNHKTGTWQPELQRVIVPPAL